MNADKFEFKAAAQAGSTGEAAGVGPAVGVLRSSEETLVTGAE